MKEEEMVPFHQILRRDPLFLLLSLSLSLPLRDASFFLSSSPRTMEVVSLEWQYTLH